MYLSDLFVVATNLAGLPAISVPIGRSRGLPVGGQLIAPAFQEDRMIQTARVLERVVDQGAEAL